MALVYDVNKNITSRAMSDMGDALLVKGENGKYHLLLPVTNMPATGSAPEQQEKTVTTDRKKTYIPSRQDNPQKEYTYYAGRDNFMRIKELLKKGNSFDFMQLNRDYTGHKFSGAIATYQDEVSVGSNATAKLVITVSKSEELPVDNVYELLEDTVAFENEVPDTVILEKSGTVTYTMASNPADATISATSDTETIATVQASGKAVTITALEQAGSSIVKITGTKEGCQSGFTTVLVIVPEA